MKNAVLLSFLLTFFCFIRAVEAETPSPVFPDTVTVSLDSMHSPICFQGADGAIFISLEGGTAPFSFLWSNGAMTEDLTSAVSGFYSVLVTDAENIEVVLDSIFLPELANPLAATLSYLLRPDCNGSLGALGVQLSGNAPPFELMWSNGQTTDTITGLPAGTYDLEVKDDNGCTANYSYVLAPLYPSVALSSDGDITCSHPIVRLDGSTSVVGPNMVFKWEATNGGQIISPTDSLVVFTDAAGDYSLVLNDTLTGCSSAAAVTIAADTLAPLVDAGSDLNVACTNALLTLNGSAIAGPNHTITVQWTAFNNANIVAGEDTLTPEIDHAGTYVLTVQIVENGCAASDTIQVTADNDPPALTVVGGTFNCAVPTVSLLAEVDTANTIFNWSGPNGFFSNELNPVASNAGNYVFTITDTLTTCTSVATAMVLADTIAPTIEAIGGTITCTNPLVQLSFTASTSNVSITWSGPNGFTSTESNPAVSEGGNYTLTIIDTTNGCSTTTETNVEVDIVAPLADAGADVNTACDNTVLALGGNASAAPNYTFTTVWTSFDGGNILSGENTLTPIVDHEGTYVLTVQIIENGCTATDTITVTGNNAPPALLVTGGSITCISPTVLLSAQVDTAGTQFGWSGPNGFISFELDTLVTDAGNYIFTVTDTLTTCTSVAVAEVLLDNNSPVLTATGGVITCTIPAVTLNFTSSSADIEFVWNGPNGFNSTSTNPLVDEPGDYTLSVTDTLNGCASTLTVEVESDTLAPIADAGDDTTLTCILSSLELGGNSTSIGAEFAYNWTTVSGNIVTGDDSSSPTVDAPGTYLLLVTNTVNGCTADDSIIVGEDVVAPLVAASGGNITCLSPTVTLFGTFTPGNIVFGWTGPNGYTSSQLNPVVAAPGTYTLTVTNTLNGCSNTAIAVVNLATTPPSVQATGGSIGCSLAPVTLVATAQGNNLTFAWSGPNGFTSNLQNPVVNASGSYTVTVTDGLNGCTSSATAIVSLNTTAPVAVAGPGFSLNCNLLSGKLNGAGSSQGIGITYLWSTTNGNIVSGGNTLMPTVNAPGTYTLTVTNQINGCVATSSTVVTQAAPVSVLVTTTDAFCFGFPSGSATANPSGGTGFYNYTWSNGVHVQTANGLVAGNYSVTVTDFNGCSAISTATIGQPAAALAINVTATAQTIPGLNNGTASVTASGGTFPYFFLWSNGSNDPIVTGLAPGAYGVTVSDANGCSTSGIANVNAASCILTASVSTTNVACFGNATGTATVTVANQMPPVVYAWSTGSSQATATGLAAGSYSVTVNDNSACPQVLAFVITEPTQLVATELFHIDASCPAATDGSLTAAVNGGIQPYVFSWSNGSNTATANNLGAGSYTLEVTDANGCEVTLTSSITGVDTEAPVLVLQDQVISLNANGQANITAVQFNAGSTDNCGIASYTISQSTFDCSQVGTFQVVITATDVSGLQTTGSAQLTVEDNTAPTLICPTNSSVAACNATVSFSLPTVNDNCGVDMSLLVQTSGLASGADFPIGTTVQSFSYTDVSGNVGTCSFEVTVADALAFTATLSDATCAGECDGGVNLTMAGGLQPVTILWSNGGNGNNLCAGNYSVSISDAGGCSEVLNFTINEPTPLVITNTLTHPNCPSGQNGSIQAVVVGGTAGYSYAWSNGSTAANLNGLLPGDYTLVVTDFNGCSSSETVTLLATDTEAPTLVLQNVSVALGANGSVTLDPLAFNGGSTDNCGIVNWTISPTSFSCGNLGSQTVTLTFTDASGNSSSGTATVTVIDNIAPVLTCPTNVSVSYCNPTATFTLPTVTDNCPLNPVLLLQTGGLPSGSDFPAGLTTQTFSYTDLAGNQATCSFVVTVSGPATVTPSSTQVSCNSACDGSASVTINGGLAPFNVTWSNGQIGLSATGLCAGNYEASVTDAVGCLQTLSFTISQPTALQLTVDNIINDVHNTGAGAVQVSVTGGSTPYSYAWTLNGQPFSPNQDLSNVVAGNYALVVTDNNGCTVSSITITIQNLTSVGETSWSESVSLAPNPASTKTRVILDNPIVETLEVRIFDLNGKLLLRQSFMGHSKSFDLDLTGIPAGVYQVQLASEGHLVVRRLVVSH